MRKLLVAACLMGVATATLAVNATTSRRGLVVHEWGTFLAMNGSDGVTLDGMYHEEHALPGFVHARRTSELRLPTSNLKGETPVIYFYADTPTQVSVEVKFPGGIWTQWYPQASFVGPSFVQTGSLKNARNGRIGWTVNVVPPSQPHAEPPPTAEDALWNFTRHVDAAYVSPINGVIGGAGESERFIFYRGLGDARLPLRVSATDGARLTCGGDLREGLRHVYVLRVERGQGVYRYLPSLGCDQRVADVVPAMDRGQPISRFATALADDLATRLVESGLYEKEARAMVNTWRTSYFTSDGVRVLFVLPQSWTDRFIPMTVRPEPDEIVRVMVGRIELLTPERERAAEAAIADLASPDATVRGAAFALLREQGRYVEPIVRRTMQSSTDERVRTLARRLLLTDFVTDLRSAVNEPADGRRLFESDQTFARAQLAALLRDIGLVDEARQEGEIALAALAEMRPPSMTDHASRNTYRALARANEGAGRDAEALKWYSEFVEFGSTFRSCSGCHSLAGPRDTSFFPDWWAGRRFAELAIRTGEAQRLIDADEAALKNKRDALLPQIRLGYLYEARGDTARAERIWARVAPSTELRASASR